jgi:hypothetical protein
LSAKRFFAFGALLVAAAAGCGRCGDAPVEGTPGPQPPGDPRPVAGPCQTDQDCVVTNACGCGCFAVLKDHPCWKRGCDGGATDCSQAHAACDPVSHSCIVK